MSAILFSFLFIMSLGATAFADGFPKKAMTFIVGSSPGGGFDLQGRLFSKHWPNYLPKKVPMIVKNVTGGGGLLAANRAWVSPPDGHTLMQIKVGGFSISQVLHPSQVKFDITKWIYIGKYTYDVNAFVARKDVAAKIKNYQDLVNYSKIKALSATTGGVSGSMHNKELIFSNASGLPMRYVHFKGVSEATASLLRNEADFLIVSASTAARQDKDLRTLFIFTDKQDDLTSFAPTALDFGMPGDVLDKITENPVFSAPRAIAVPPGTPDNVVKILRDSFWKMVSSEKCNQDFKKVKHFLDPIKGEEFEKQVPKMLETVKDFAQILKKEIK